MTADPRLVPDAAVLDEVTYREAAELAYNGAKVLHPRTLAPLVESHIPVWSKNSFAPEKPGTKIVPRISGPNGARAVTSMPRVALISLEPAHATLPGAQVMARALDALARANVEVLALSSSSYRQSFCFLVRSEELEKTLEALESALALELAHGYLRADRGGQGRRPAGRRGRRHAGHAGACRAHLHGHFARAHQHHRHRAGVERADHRDRGAARRPGDGRARGARRVRHGNAWPGKKWNEAKRQDASTAGALRGASHKDPALT